MQRALQPPSATQAPNQAPEPSVLCQSQRSDGGALPRLKSLPPDQWRDWSPGLSTEGGGGPDRDRGQAVVFGLMMVIIVGVMGFAILQTEVAPAVQKDAEARHFVEVRGDLQDLRDAMYTTAGGGTGRSVTIRMGGEYPQSVLLIHPSGLGGQLHTTDRRSVQLQNVRAVDPDVQVYFEEEVPGESLTYGSRALTYTPVYHQFQPVPTLHLETSVLFTRLTEGDHLVTGQRLIDGRQLAVVNQTGTIAIGKTAPLTVRSQPLSASSQTIAVTNVEGANPTFVIETEISAEKWRRLLASELVARDDTECEFDGDSKHVCRVTQVNTTHVEIVLERDVPGGYQVSTALVGLKTPAQPRVAERPDAAYLVRVSFDEPSVPWAGRQRLVVQVRDRYHNPVGGQKVTAEIVTEGDSGYLGDDEDTIKKQRITDGDGEAGFVYTAPDDPDPDEPNHKTVEVRVWFSDPTAPTSGIFTIHVQQG